MPPYMQMCVLAMQQDDKTLFAAAVERAAGHLDETSNGLALIHRAARQSDIFYLKYLVAAGANINRMSGKTPSFPPIAEAVLEGNHDHVNFLLGEKADMSICGDHGVSFVFELFKEAVNDSMLMTRRSTASAVTLLMPHLDHDLRDSRGRRLMVAALENLPFRAIQELKGAGYPVRLVDIEAALMHGRLASLQLLLADSDVLKNATDAERLKLAIINTRKILMQNVTTAQQFLHAQAFWGKRGDVFDPEGCLTVCLKTIENFHVAERVRFDRAIERLHTGGDRPLPLPGRRM